MKTLFKLKHAGFKIGLKLQRRNVVAAQIHLMDRELEVSKCHFSDWFKNGGAPGQSYVSDDVIDNEMIWACFAK